MTAFARRDGEREPASSTRSPATSGADFRHDAHATVEFAPNASIHKPDDHAQHLDPAQQQQRAHAMAAYVDPVEAHHAPAPALPPEIAKSFAALESQRHAMDAALPASHTAKSQHSTTAHPAAASSVDASTAAANASLAVFQHALADASATSSPATPTPPIGPTHHAATGLPPAIQAQFKDLEATTLAMQLVVQKDHTDSKYGNYAFLNALETARDPEVRAAMSAKFEAMTKEKLDHFVDHADWYGKRDKDQAKDLISEKRDQTDGKLAALSPEARKELNKKADAWAQQILSVTRKDGANDDVNAQKIARVLGPRSPEEIEAIRDAVRAKTNGATIYQELDLSLSKGNEDEAVAGLKGDPVGAAKAGLENARGDAARLKEILRGLSPAQIAELKQREGGDGLGWVADSLGDLELDNKRELGQLVAGDRAAADATRIATLIIPTGLDGVDTKHAGLPDDLEKRLDERKPENVLQQLESMSADELKAARAAFDKEAGQPGRFDEFVKARFGGDKDPTTYMRISALVRGDKIGDKAIELRDGMRQHKQKEIEDALANPDLDPALSVRDPGKFVKAQIERQELAQRVGLMDKLDQQVDAIAQGKPPVAPIDRDLRTQLADSYHAFGKTEMPEASGFAKAMTGDAEDNMRAAYRKSRDLAARDGNIAANELLDTGSIATETKVYRAQNKHDERGEADLLDGVTTNTSLASTQGAFEAKYGKPMLEDKTSEYLEAAATAKAQFYSEVPITVRELATAMARNAMNGEAIRVENTREFGVRDERDVGLEASLQREIAGKQHSDSLEAEEQRRVMNGGNLGTENLVQANLERQAGMLEPSKAPGDAGKLVLKDGVTKDEFHQTDATLTAALGDQRDEKTRLANHTARVFTTIAKIAALAAGQPELYALLDLASDLAAVAIKREIAGEAYDPADDMKLAAIQAAVNVATIGIGRAGVATKVEEARGVASAAQLGESTATQLAETAVTKDARAELASAAIDKTTRDAGLAVDLGSTARAQATTHAADASALAKTEQRANELAAGQGLDKAESTAAKHVDVTEVHGGSATWKTAASAGAQVGGTAASNVVLGDDEDLWQSLLRTAGLAIIPGLASHRAGELGAAAKLGKPGQGVLQGAVDLAAQLMIGNNANVGETVAQVGVAHGGHARRSGHDEHAAREPAQPHAMEMATPGEHDVDQAPRRPDEIEDPAKGRETPPASAPIVSDIAAAQSSPQPAPPRTIEQRVEDLRSAGVLGRLDEVEYRAQGTGPDAMAARGELQAIERARERGHGEIELLSPPSGKGAEQGLKTPEARLGPVGNARFLEVKTATEPPTAKSWESHVDKANKQIKERGKGELSFDWTQTNIFAGGEFTAGIPAIEALFERKMTNARLRSVTYWEIVWRDQNGDVMTTSRSRDSEGRVSAITTRRG